MAWKERRCVAFSWVFIFLHLCALVAHRADALPGGPPPARVRVGVMLDLASATGLRLQTAIRMSVEDYYAVHPDAATIIELHLRDAPANAVAAVVSAAEDLVKNAQVQAIVAPETPAEAELVATVGSRAHVPVLSYAATASPVYPSDTSSFLVRTCADDSVLAKPVAEIMRSFGWRAAVLVHEDSRFGIGIIPALADAFLDVGATIAGRAAVPADASDDRLDAVLYRAVSKTTSRVFVVHLPSPLSLRLFRRAKKAGFMSRGHVWIATDGSGGLNRLSAEDIGAMQGALIVRPQLRPTVRASNFAARFNARFSHEMAGSMEIQKNPTLPMLWAYDTAWAVAVAAEALGTALETPRGSQSGPEANHQLDVLTAGGAALFKAVLDTTFDGLAGKFRLVDAQLQMPAYEIVNVVRDGTNAVGFWTENSKISQDLHAASSNGLMHIIWPGEQSHSRVPKGLAVSPTGQDLVVAVPVKHGFHQFVDVSVDSTSGRLRVTGYCIDVFDVVMKGLPAPVSYQYLPFNGSSESYDRFVGLIPEQKADAVVGDVTITSSRMGVVDYTMPFTESGWSMVVAVQTSTSTSMFFFLKPLTASLWLASFAFFVFTGFVVWVIEHRINPEFRGTPSQQLGLIFYYAFSTLVFAQKEKLESNLSRFAVIIWLFVVLILTSSYTASLTSMLTVQQLQPTLTDVKDLISRGDYVGFQEGSFVASELKKMNFDESRLRSYSNPDQYAQALSKGSANGGVDAIFDEIPYLKLFLSQYCDGYAMVGPIYKGTGFGFVFPKGSPMVPDVSRAIVSLTEGDEMALIERKWFGDPGACDSKNGGVGSYSLSFWSFSGLFLVTGVASGLMLIVYLATFVYRERNELRAAESGAGSSSLRRLRAWLQHYDTKDTRSPSFKRWNDGSMGNGVDAQQRNGAGQGDATQHTTAPEVSPLGGGAGDSDVSAEASSTEEEVANSKCGQDILQENDEVPSSQGNTREVCTLRSA